MIGAIIGDIVGSRFERGSEKPSVFPFYNKNCSFTDDSVLTIAIAKALLECLRNNDLKNSSTYYFQYLRLYGKRYPHAGYGQSFNEWLSTDNPKPYNSYGNGSAMRVSPVGYAFSNLKDTLKEAKKTAEQTHNHSDGIKGAKAVAGSVFLAFNNYPKQAIKDFVENEIGYSVSFSLDDLHENYKFEIQCSKSVPQAIYAFLESTDFEDAIKKAIYIGGDSDTIASITGAIAGAFYKYIPESVKSPVLGYLDAEQKKVIKMFNEKFKVKI